MQNDNDLQAYGLQEACELAAGFIHDVLWHAETTRQHHDLHRALIVLRQIAPQDFEVEPGLIAPDEKAGLPANSDGLPNPDRRKKCG